MKKCYNITATRTLTAGTDIIAETAEEALAIAKETNFVFDDAPDGVVGDECELAVAETEIPARISVAPAEGVLMSYWNKDKNAWEGFELFVNEVTNIYNHDDLYETMHDTTLGYADYSGKKFGISLGDYQCKVDGIVGRYDDILGEKGVCFTTAGDDTEERLGVMEKYPQKMGEVVFGETAECGCRPTEIYKLERVIVSPTDEMIKWVLAHKDVSWRLANYTRI